MSVFFHMYTMISYTWFLVVKLRRRQKLLRARPQHLLVTSMISPVNTAWPSPPQHHLQNMQMAPATIWLVLRSVQFVLCVSHRHLSPAVGCLLNSISIELYCLSIVVFAYRVTHLGCIFKVSVLLVHPVVNTISWSWMGWAIYACMLKLRDRTLLTFQIHSCISWLTCATALSFIFIWCVLNHCWTEL